MTRTASTGSRPAPGCRTTSTRPPTAHRPSPTPVCPRGRWTRTSTSRHRRISGGGRRAPPAVGHPTRRERCLRTREELVRPRDDLPPSGAGENGPGRLLRALGSLASRGVRGLPGGKEGQLDAVTDLREPGRCGGGSPSFALVRDRTRRVDHGGRAVRPRRARVGLRTPGIRRGRPDRRDVARAHRVDPWGPVRRTGRARRVRAGPGEPVAARPAVRARPETARLLDRGPRAPQEADRLRRADAAHVRGGRTAGTERLRSRRRGRAPRVDGRHDRAAHPRPRLRRRLDRDLRSRLRRVAVAGRDPAVHRL